MKILVGLTGKSGSGKSYAGALFKKWGANVIDCDEIAHSVLTFPEVMKKIKYAFGDEVFEDGFVSRKKLGALVFKSPEKLKTLNRIVHPIIVEEILSRARNANEEISVADGSELEESGFYKLCDKMIVIKAKKEIRLERIMQRDNISLAEASLRVNAQKDFSKSAIIIENNESSLKFEEKLKNLYISLTEESNAIS
jgi:dephospho-CoA kinase